MIIKNAKKSEPWEVETFWEWIPSEKRKLQANQDCLDQKILPYEKIYTKNQSKSKERDNYNEFENNLKQTLNVQQWNPNSINSKDRPLSAKLNSSIQTGKKTLQNNFMNETSKNIFSDPKQQLNKDEIKPLNNKQKKKIEEELRKYDEFRKYQTEQEAKDRNKNLLFFNARFPHIKIGEYYKVSNGWEKIPLIEELPQSPQKGRIPDDLLGQAHIEGQKIKQKIVFYKEDKNEGISSIQDNEDIKAIQNEILALQEPVKNQNNAEKNQKSTGNSIFTNKKLQEQRESVKIQQEINKLLAKNSKQIQPKTGKEAFGVHRKREINSFLDMRKMMKVSSKVDNMFNKIKKGYPQILEFADEHMDEMNEIREKLQNRSLDLSLERQLDEMEYDQGKLYDEQHKNEQKGNENDNNQEEQNLQEDRFQEGSQNQQEIEQDQQENQQNSMDDLQNFNDEKGDQSLQEDNQNQENDLFGMEEIQLGDQAAASPKPKIQKQQQVKMTTFLTQEKVEKVNSKVSKVKDTQLKSQRAQFMESLMNEIDLGDDELFEEFDSQAKKYQEEYEEKDDNNLYDSLEIKPIKKAQKSKQGQIQEIGVQFQNNKLIERLENADEDSQDNQNQNSQNILKDLEKQEQENSQGEENGQVEKQSESKLEKQQGSIRSKTKSQAQSETFDVGEDKKQLWQKEVLLGNHRAYLDDNQKFDPEKFVKDVDEETRDKCRDKVKEDIKKLEDKTKRKIDIIKGGSVQKRSLMLKEKSEKLNKINSRFQKSLQQIKDTMDQSKKDSAVIDKKPSSKQLLEQAATKILKETQKNTESHKRLKIDNATQNEIKKHEFKFYQKEKVNDEEPHPWL
ncbi:hypothetical protein TTHERM_00532360 (macronuclear) [Tetrahymena thermophila SB210]|uniref:Uncharacterized protein n=1 Tax=Tetrahymena thermophila (strain SB210) TaxID=312017 RepID=Q248D1_TETTS|nr:hypothetical protein TTHERM_00532360 [Tetrahymena thermophila SB210]EAS04114.1 hypothetical protein TTHERM_00532360 [Tetrahymena thermophila SB210]|eukprot:XP_001024359.1 hypothetical protein TTHERM_00532360 [Tetrahymena thermophila SB210]